MPSSFRHLSIPSIAAVWLVAWATVSAPQPQSAAIPVAEFWDRVQATLKTVDSLSGQPAGTVRAALDREAQSWAGVTAVRLDDGALTPVDTSALVSLLRADPPDLKAIHTRLQTLLDARAGWYPPALGGRGSNTDPNAALKEVLAAPEFQQQAAAPDPLQAFIDNLQTQFWKWVASLLPANSLADIGWIRWVIIVLAGLALAAILWFAMRAIAGGLVAEDSLADADGIGAEAVTAEGAFKQAQETSRAGDYRSAVRWLYLSSLLTLDERGVLHYDRTRTNREYLRSVGSSPELAHSLGDIVDVFDRVWYGFQPIDRPAFDQYVRRVMELRRIR